MFIKLLRSVLTLIVGLTLTAAAAWAQTGTIEGQVTDQATGEALISANVFIPSISRGAATNVEGDFSIEEIPYGTYELRVSYIGYTTETVTVTVDEATENVNVTLSQSAGQLDELIVTALGTERRINELSYSAEKLDVEDITQSGTSNLMQSLAGNVAGLQVNSRNGIGGSTDIILRGINSITGSNQPLIVVDGVPYSNERFNQEFTEQGFSGYDFGSTALDINPAMVESMTVLKGAAATALYGSRAANGAIIITTKSGAPQGEQVTVNVRSSAGFSFVNPQTFPEYQREYGAGYIKHFISAPATWTQDPDDVVDNVIVLGADASFGPKFDGRPVYVWKSFFPNHPLFGQAVPYLPAENMPIEFFDTGVNLTNSINLRGGINNGTGYYSLGYAQSNVTGFMPNAQLDSYNLNFAAGYDVSDKLNVEASIDFTRTEGRARPKRGYSTIMSSFRQWWQTNVDVTELKAAYFRNRQNVTWNPSSSSTTPVFWDNPYFESYENFETDTRDRYVGYVEAQYDLADWINLTGRASIDAYHNLIELRLATGSVPTFRFPAGSGYQKRMRDFQAYNFRLTANFNRQLSQDFELNGRLGVLARRTHTTGTVASTSGGLITPGLYSLDNSVNKILFPNETDVRTGLNAVYASARLGYEDMVFLRATARRDKSSTLPEGNNIYFYPSVSGSFLFSQLLDAEWLSFGKIRASWARVGAPAQPLSLRDFYQRGFNFGSVRQFALPAVKANSNLKPEITESWDIGLQLGFLNSRLYVEASYYNGSTYNQIFRVNISNATGYEAKIINAGQIDNNGIEVSLRARPVITNSFSWTVSANWFKNYNTVVELTEGVEYFELAAPQGPLTIGAFVGEPIGVIRGPAFVRAPNGKPIVDSETGYYLVSESSTEIIGNMLPDWNAGITNTFSYKNLSLNVLVDVRWGGEIFSLDQYYGQGTGLYPITAGVNQRGEPKRAPVDEGGGVLLPGVNWTDTNGNGKPDKGDKYTPNSTYGPLTNYAGVYGFAASPAEAYIYDGSYVKLREVGLTYNLPVEWLEAIGGIDRASVSVVGRNLWIIHKNLPYADPESSLSEGSVSGYSGGMLPSARSFTFTVNLNF